MTARAAAPSLPWRRARQFARTPKGTLILIFVPLAVVAAASAGVATVLPVTLATVLTATALDLAINRLQRRAWIFPSGAIITGLIIAFVLSPAESWFAPVIASAVAIGSKHAIRSRLANVFNPAALAIVATSVLLGTVQSWWGALPDLGPVGVALLLVSGVFMADRINKLPLVLAFLGTYFFLFSEASFIVDPSQVAEVFRAPDLQAVLFFAFFMLDDPPTCPVRYFDQAVFALIVGLVSYFVFITYGAVYYLPAGLLAGNAFEALRRRFLRLGYRAAAA